MATQRHRGIPLSSLSPKFLYTNSTSHTWPFSAIAELIDNAYDPDVRAKRFWIDWTQIKGLDCLSFMDNGTGLSRDRMHKMLSFGFSNKKEVRGHIPVGVYGNGFKSGSMRLGKDAIVFTKTKDTMSVGLLSQSYLAAIKVQQLLVPIITFRRDGQNFPEDAASLQAILKHSLFNTERELFSELRAISAAGRTGTRIIIWNLRKTTSGETEFDFDVDKCDIRIRTSLNASETSSPASDYSLRAYCSILYLRPRMQINIRGKRVRTQLISKGLAYIANDIYRPSFLSQRIQITFGFNTKSKEHCGIMMYHKNRLIKAFVQVGCQRKADKKGAGVIGIIECNFLQPTHNKQDFDDTDKYRKTIHNLGIKLEEYWNEVWFRHKNEDPECTIPIEDTKKVPDQSWVQCDSCLKWRRLPDGTDCSLLPERWLCNMNPDPQFRSCHVEEELEEQEEDQRSYPKPYKRQRKNSKPLREDKVPVIQVPAQAGHPLAGVRVSTVAWQPLSSAPFSTAQPDTLSTVHRSGDGDHADVVTPAEIQRSSVNPSPVVDPRSLSSPRPRRKQTILPENPTEMDAMVTAPHLPVTSVTQTNCKPVIFEKRRSTEQGGTQNLNVRENWGMVTEDKMMEAFERHKWLRPDEDWYGTEGLSEEETEDASFFGAGETFEPEGKIKDGAPQQEVQKELSETMQVTALERDTCRNQIQELQLELQKLRQQCGNVDTWRTQCNQLKSKMEGLEKEKARLSSLCEALRTELGGLRENTNRRREETEVRTLDGAGGSDEELRRLRRNVGRLLASFVPALDLKRVDYDSDVIDVILDQVLREVT
ncbi:MORC family CW-type zinc finger protein 3-like [Chanos chanos]|uniref:MORC family CW-type zinc finger protein 3-like n=1 Tax=Chanos chanos TaxID=29144 RepID=A0A6J2VRX3_CHACN|nr:MORC family CW-type zinc finger protein 3-like [Chanos chanos]